MKKVLMFVVLCAFVMGMSVPASALETDFSGSFYVEGILNSAPNMLDSDNTSDYRQMRLRVQTDFKVSDHLTLTTRFDALEKVLSSKDSAFDNNEDDDNIDFDRAYLTYISPIGMFEVGRLKGVVWGTSFCDDESDTDRIKYTVPIEIGDGKLYLAAVAEKVTENDTMINDDNDKYYLGAVYKTEQYATGVLTAQYNYNKMQDSAQAFAVKDLTSSYESNKNAVTYRSYLGSKTAPDELKSYLGWYGTNATYAKAAATAAASGDMAKAAEMKGKINTDWPQTEKAAQSGLSTIGSRGTTCDGKAYLVAPYFQGKFGDISLEAELDYVFGTLEYAEQYNAKDTDVSLLAYFVEGAYDFSPINLRGGFACASGDSNYSDDELSSMGLLAPGVDWEKVFILNSDYHGMNSSLGNGIGNHVGSGSASASIAMLDGYQMIYGGVDYAITDAITLGFIAAMSKADDIPEGLEYDDDQGMEYDFSFEWKITDNLTYKAIAAYLDGGDYWTTRKTGTVEKTSTGDDLVDPQVYALFHRLTLTF